MLADLFPSKTDLRELARPWKLVTFAIGMSWLLYGALNYGISDWDVGISILMGGLTYVLAPWSIKTIFAGLRKPSWRGVPKVGISLGAAWFVIDGVYVIYHTAVGNEMLHLENFYASTALFFLAGSIWLYDGSMRDLLRDLRSCFKANSKEKPDTSINRNVLPPAR